ncbi:hypothetical protein R1sor_016316 [Riccia sorocarpa]|uniref:Uncharacterized protein n=1 Tax=Riccia sorocarpa TaxID=122646 RepID=A0ABD3HHE7_9MARC
MVRTKQTVKKSTGGKPPDPRLGQWFKDMCKAGETSLSNVMDRGDESPTAACSEAEELEVQDMEQDAGPDAHPGHEDEAASDEAEDGVEPIDMQHMVIVTRAFVVPRPRRIDADDVFEWLTKFEEEKKSGKRKTTTPRTGNNKKKPRPVEALPEEPFDPMTKFLEKDERKTLKTDYEKYRHMYPFGPTSVYHIPVEKIREAPPIFVYKSINFQYVLDTYYNMITKSHFTPQIADLLPFSQKDSSPIVSETYAKTHKLNWYEDLIVVKALIADPDVVFLAISGQHSSRAQQLFLLEVRVPDDVREQNRYRRSRILNGGFDPTKYHDISYLDNKNNETQVFVSSFVECLNQARAQWITLRRSKSTQGSTTKNDPFDQFKSIVCQTMGRRSYKEIIPLVCCSDETYAAFEKFVKRWKEGKIPDVHGTIGPSKDPRTGLVCDRDVSQLCVNRFRPINGLSDEDLKLAWTVLEEGKVWVT